MRATHAPAFGLRPSPGKAGLLRLLLFLALAACTPNFQDRDVVVDLRVLAVTAEPPEALYDVDAGTVDSVSLTYLVVDPARPQNTAIFSAHACQPTDSRRCDSGLAFALPSATGDTAHDTFHETLAIPPSVLGSAEQLAKLGGYNGIEVQVSFAVDDGDPAGVAEGDKVVVYSPAGTTPNHNPTMIGVDTSVGGVRTGSLIPGQTLNVQAGVDNGLRPVLATNAIETYTIKDLNGKEITLTESPTYSFYTTAGGSFDRDTANEPDNGVAPPDGLTRFTAAGRSSGTLWIVVRDGRGGESWLTYPWVAN
jgi:hypothetical protein